MNSKIKHDEISTEPSQKKLKTDDINSQAKLEIFFNWCREQEIFIDYAKVEISFKNTSHNYGMIAKTDINENTCLVKIPRTCLLSLDNTSFNKLVGKNELKSESNWAKLVIALMFELDNDDNSKWAPYLKVFPNYNDLDLPMFWSKEQFELLLKNTCIKSNVENDLLNMKKEYDEIVVPFIKKHIKKFSEKCLDFSYYQKLVAFIMAYSFTDPNEDPDEEGYVGPKMVPVADILNHIAKNNAEIRYTPEELQIYSTKFIKHGEEVYNTYGEHSNADLLHMYGFVEEYPENIFDNVEILSENLIRTIKELKNSPDDLIQKKIEIFYELDLIGKSSFIISEDGILNEEEILQLLEIYTMTRDELEDFIETDFEFEEDENEDYSLDKDKLKNIPLDWKNLIVDTCKIQLEALKSDINENYDEKYQIYKQRIAKVNSLKNGHIKILENFLSYF